MLNKVTLIGRLGKDPEIKTFDNGNSIANFTLATNESYKDKNGERKEVTDWHNIQIGIPGLVKLVQQYFKKGDVMYLEGKIRTREYEKEGQKRYITEIIGDTIKFLPKAGGSMEGAGQNGTNVSTETTNPFDNEAPIDDDLPF
jgi:single-strand DNA-binding protein